MSISINVNDVKKKVKDCFINVDGTKKKVTSIWVNKDEVPAKIYSNFIEPLKEQFVCGGSSGKSYYSTDGLTWKEMTGLTGITIYGIVYGKNRIVCVGTGGKSYYSTDGLTWKEMTGLPSGITFYGVTYGNDKFVCVGDSGKSYYSTDGLTWKEMTGLPSGIPFLSVAYGNGIFVCVGQVGKSYASTDGLTWNVVLNGLSSNYHFYSITNIQDEYFYCCGGDSYKSLICILAGSSWSSVRNKNEKCYDGITSNNVSEIVCIGKSGASYNFKQDKNMTGLNTSYNYNGVTYGNDKFVCVGDSGKSYYSTDGLTWKEMTGLPSYFYGNAVTYCNAL